MPRWDEWKEPKWLVGLMMLMFAVSWTACAARAKLGEHGVTDLTHEEEVARGRAAYERVRSRIARLRRGMSTAEVEEALEGVVAVQQEGGMGGRQKTLIDGLLCVTDPSPLRRRWLFGYEEGAVVLTGFALEFERDDPKGAWFAQRVDESPRDECPEGASQVGL